MTFAIKAEVADPLAAQFVFRAQKTMYGGKSVAAGDTIFIFASENEGGLGLVASGVVISAKALPKKQGVARQTPRVSISVRRAALAKRALGRTELRRFREKNDGRAETELSFKFYRQATTRSLASQMQRRRSSAGFSEAADPEERSSLTSRCSE